MELSYTVRRFRFSLNADEVYYKTAQESLSRARDIRALIDTIAANFASNSWYNHLVANDWGDEIDFSVVEDEHDLSPEDIALVHEEENVLEGHVRVYIQSIACVHIFAAAALEACINSAAQERLKGKSLNEFDKLSLEGKWLFLPQLISIEKFDPGAEPFQSFSRLVSFRNKLIHLKSVTMSLDDVLNDSNPLGLGLTSAGRSLEAAGKMLSNLASQLGKTRRRKNV